MKTITAGGKELVFWDSIKELPMDRYVQFQSIALQDAGIGTSVEQYDNHESSIDAFLHENRVEDALKERENKRFGVFAMMQNINLKSMTLSCLCQSINKEERPDFSDSGLEETSKVLNASGMTANEVISLTNDLKKNWNPN
jgi:hypothetical protein